MEGKPSTGTLYLGTAAGAFASAVGAGAAAAPPAAGSGSDAEPDVGSAWLQKWVVNARDRTAIARRMGSLLVSKKRQISALRAECKQWFATHRARLKGGLYAWVQL